MAAPVVVGLDGSEASLTAERWAADEAAARGLPLHLLYSWVSQALDAPLAQESPDKHRYGDQVLGAAQEIAHKLHPDLSVTTEQVPEPAVQALVEHSGQATLMVLGSRGRGALAGFLLGSVSLHVLGRAECPVVTVRARERDTERCGANEKGGKGRGRSEDAWGWDADDAAEIVVGVQDLGPAGDTLLDFAFVAADTHHRKLRAVRAWGPPTVVSPGPTAPPTLPDEITLFTSGEEAALAEALAPWQTTFPGVEVIQHVESGAAAPVLLGAACHAGLLVVGRRTHRSPTRLGPVAHAALHHACCPVAVVPHG
ncbi:universal stress protein [Streptomyces halobius]|uniref:Universal stress protein n=1 Tax=Streptomyces halobius TaxID=2879846 RepID=A0ABY4M1B3_9ACTN|nr:universal stress protein [Streptomyces halobius]UQA90958.1 universal stress protein [Streptomyces halobius]